MLCLFKVSYQFLAQFDPSSNLDNYLWKMDEKLNDFDNDEIIEFDEVLTDENISQDQINEMKMLGIERPAGVSSERWWRIQDIRFEHEHMIYLAASGIPQWMIAKQTGYDQQMVSKVLNTPDVRVKVQAKIQEIYGVDHKKAVKDLGLKAIGVVSDVLDNGKEAEKASMAKFVVEHSIGKASQDIQVTKTSLTEVIVKIDQMRSDQLRDVSSVRSQLPKEEDPFDTIINEVIPKGLVIGKRSSGEG